MSLATEIESRLATLVSTLQAQGPLIDNLKAQLAAAQAAVVDLQTQLSSASVNTISPTMIAAVDTANSVANSNTTKLSS